MTDLINIIRLAYQALQFRLTFGQFTFTVMQAYIGLACLSICIGFVIKLFDLR